MAGVVLILLALLVALPVAVLVGGCVIAAALGMSLNADARARYAGSELLDLDG